MQLIKMTYKVFEFDANPSIVKLDYSKNIATQFMIDSTDKTQEMSVSPVIVTGNGSFAGVDARDKAFQLQQIFKSSGSDYLFLSGFQPIRAFFKNLSISTDAKRGTVDYSFTFVEDYNGKKLQYDFGYTMAEKDENLFDVANRLGVGVELLVAKNDFEDVFAVNEGDKVYYA